MVGEHQLLLFFVIIRWDFISEREEEEATVVDVDGTKFPTDSKRQLLLPLLFFFHLSFVSFNERVYYSFSHFLCIPHFI